MAHDEDAVCDFCGKRGVAWKYPCRTFHRDEETVQDGIAGVRSHRFVGDWAACTECHDVYEEGGLGALVEYVVSIQIDRKRLANPAAVKAVRMEVGRLLAQFKLNRCGSAVLY